MARVDITMSIKDVEGGDELRDSVVSKSGLVGMRGMNSVLPIVDVELERASSAWVLIDHIFMKALLMLFTTFPLAGKLMKQQFRKSRGLSFDDEKMFFIKFCIQDPHSKGFVGILIMAFRVVTYRA